MRDVGRFLWLGVGLLLGAVGAFLCFDRPAPARAANDRFEDYILCTGPVTVGPRSPTDGVWLLDYRSGKLMGTVINRANGKLVGWAEVDLVSEFNLKPKQEVHFLMTTGTITQGQAALYLAETSTGKFGVYTMGPRPDTKDGVVIRRHDMVLFRQPPPEGAP
ncbi:MAG: hypothetical protein IT429_03995 [Gemmataceae bacterium]|nr:hypothetical protein [Gemmataceae bacterium]